MFKLRIPENLSFPSLSNAQALQFFQLLRQGSLILTAILLTKSRLSLSGIGAYEMLMYIAYVLSFWWVSGLMQGLLSRLPQLDTVDRKKLIFNAYVVVVALSATIVAVCWLWRSQVLLLLVGQPDLHYFAVFVWFMAFHFPTYLLENLLLLQQKPYAIVGLGIFSATATMVAVLVPVYAGWNFQWSFVGLAFVAVLKHAWLLANVWQNGIWQWQWPLVANWLRLSSPLVLYALLGGLNTAYDNWLVAHHYEGDEAIFAIFRYGAQELPFALALTGALGTAIIPAIATDLNAALQSLKGSSRRLFHLLFPMAVALMLSGHWLFPWVFNPAFITSVDIFNIYLLLLISRLVFARPVLVGLQANRAVLFISIIELVVNVGLSYWLVQHFGLRGIAFGTLVAFTLEKILLCVYLYWRFGVPVGAYTDLRWFGIYASALLSAYWWVRYYG
ncbi:MAG TPA: polysaccharide biosynthesis C-terminal domain-containing protein [Saprospiraceae bacterium]|nr:polysaccharide biosynthesis C-terminal domain-containing protein [Saprospiraceae bacterium]